MSEITVLKRAACYANRNIPSLDTAMYTSAFHIHLYCIIYGLANQGVDTRLQQALQTLAWLVHVVSAVPTS